ncbi:hypothetical protein MRB53_005601 [Persea americana]|uniref:Uncharacterized protein n=1 Tax=Persea americana TaxID=3435 RepID=A0ACC2ME24_PERAE|nr:hypothetical protein MRB53_005601 [Persea americana]
MQEKTSNGFGIKKAKSTEKQRSPKKMPFFPLRDFPSSHSLLFFFQLLLCEEDMWCKRAAVALFLVVLEIESCFTEAQGPINSGNFPKGFVFGTASSAYQYEGAVKVDGRGSTVWDTFAHTFGKVIDFSNADVAVDEYHRFHEDIQLLADMGMGAYRFSIAWSRIYPSMNSTNPIKLFYDSYF